MAFKFNAKQLQALGMLRGDATHCMMYGGSRSGKTFLAIAAIVYRALKVPSRHAVLRFRFNHVKTSVIYDTLPKVMQSGLFQGLDNCDLDKTDWFYKFPNGSEIWFGGLDDKERTEKILGQEYSTLFLNECSQIPWASRNIAITRLAQNVGLRLKCIYDCNPPSSAHWTYSLFFKKKDPDENSPLLRPENYVALRINPIDNQDNLAPEYLDELKALPERARKRFLLGEFGSSEDHALWTVELIEQQRAPAELPMMQRVVVAVDPSGCSGPTDTKSDEIGIVVCGLGDDGKGYVLEDASGHFGPTQWGKIVSDLYERYAANQVIAETNFGGAMVEEVLRVHNPQIPVRVVKASGHVTGGKTARAEGVANLFEKQKVFMAGRFEKLEEQLCSMTTNGYTGSKSPDRADAMVWGLMGLFPSITRQTTAHPAFLPKVILGHPNFKRRVLS